MAPTFSGVGLAAGQGHGLEHAFVAERRFLVGSFLWSRNIGSRFSMPRIGLLAYLHRQCNPDCVNLMAQPTPAVVLQLGKPGPAPVEFAISEK
jgi:hypothetical protein